MPRRSPFWTVMNVADLLDRLLRSIGGMTARD
jgi:hypothetical protein